MRVASANLQHGVPDPVGRPALSRAIAPLRALGADVWGFQELDHRRWRTWLANQGDQLVDALGGELVWAPAKRVFPGGQANALIVRGEVVEREVVELAGEGELRVLALAVVVVGGRRWTVGTTHLALRPAVAREQLAETLHLLITRPGPWVLVGDLNLEPVDVNEVAEQHGFDVVAGPLTHSARRTPSRRLDHILTKGCTVRDSGVTKLPVSDHLAVWADVATTSRR
ncbi:MAG: endonuclease/exonuclease/phosphatase family protein [Acidimicrobiales bacterium]